MSKLKVLIVEDDAMIAEDLQDILIDAGYDVVGIAHNATKALNILEIRKVDFAFLDVTLSDQSTGIDVAHHINDKYKFPFVFLTSYSDSQTVSNVVSTNPGGYLVKPFKEKDIVPALVVACSNAQQKNVDDFPSIEVINSKLSIALSKQEHKVLYLIWLGKKNNDIAEDLYLSVNTIKTHIRRIFTKMNVSSRVAAINEAFKK